MKFLGQDFMMVYVLQQCVINYYCIDIVLYFISYQRMQLQSVQFS